MHVEKEWRDPLAICNLTISIMILNISKINLKIGKILYL
jgi:hypothetical protein